MLNFDPSRRPDSIQLYDLLCRQLSPKNAKQLTGNTIDSASDMQVFQPQNWQGPREFERGMPITLSGVRPQEQISVFPQQFNPNGLLAVNQNPRSDIKLNENFLIQAEFDQRIDNQEKQRVLILPKDQAMYTL